jgi:ketosteroid isomerase-like protein
MGIEENKRVILDWVAAVNRGDDQAILAMTTEDFGFKVMARWPHWLAYRWNRQEFAVTPRQMSTLLEKPIQMEVVNLTAEGNRVVAELKTDARMKNGKRYDNAYSLIFELKGGKISEAREYSCSALVVECFGEFNPNNPQASKAAH